MIFIINAKCPASCVTGCERNEHRIVFFLGLLSLSSVSNYIITNSMKQAQLVSIFKAWFTSVWLLFFFLVVWIKFWCCLFSWAQDCCHTRLTKTMYVFLMYAQKLTNWYHFLLPLSRSNRETSCTCFMLWWLICFIVNTFISRFASMVMSLFIVLYVKVHSV